MALRRNTRTGGSAETELIYASDREPRPKPSQFALYKVYLPLPGLCKECPKYCGTIAEMLRQYWGKVRGTRATLNNIGPSKRESGMVGQTS